MITKSDIEMYIEELTHIEEEVLKLLKKTKVKKDIKDQVRENILKKQEIKQQIISLLNK